jgi:hypothetical protein
MVSKASRCYVELGSFGHVDDPAAFREFLVATASTGPYVIMDDIGPEYWGIKEDGYQEIKAK